jgi:hypothetical protein
MFKKYQIPTNFSAMETFCCAARPSAKVKSVSKILGFLDWEEVPFVLKKSAARGSRRREIQLLFMLIDPL